MLTYVLLAASRSLPGRDLVVDPALRAKVIPHYTYVVVHGAFVWWLVLERS
jgi:hypothetical protein